ncbi:MAG TPA: hypothetical protein VHL80_15470 [Polyangia bacterium]|nr:hypothetical protein [Polyangia bacterium]
MRTVLVRYKTTPEHGAANEAAIHAVFDELRARHPAGFRYTSYRTEDATFVHIATVEAGKSPLFELPAFAAFQKQLEGHLVERPVTLEISAVDSYGGGVP